MAEFNNLPCSAVYVEQYPGLGNAFFDVVLSFQADSCLLLDILGKERCCEYFDLIEKPVDTDN